MHLQPDFIDVRVQRRIAELEYHLYPFRKPVRNWHVSRHWPEHITRPEAATKLLQMGASPSGDIDLQAMRANGHGEVRTLFSVGAANTQTYWLSTEVTVPEDLRGKTVHLLLPTNAEALLYVDGQPWQGLDDNRALVLLSRAGEPGRVYRLDVMLFTGRDQKDKTLAADLVCLDRAVKDYQYDLRTVLGVARTLPEESTTAIRLWQALTASVNAIDFHRADQPVDVTEAAQILRRQIQALRDQGHGPTDVDIFLVGNSHIDVTWLWTLAETRQKMGRTTATALRYLDELPAYRFAQSQPQLYEFLRQDFPDLFRRVQERVAEGRWEIVGAAWVEPDCNITGGEALVRQILYGQKFWQEHFGRETNVMWLPDTFGYAWALPQILKKSGLDTFVTQKLTWSETNTFPHGHFDWEGVDGTRIRCTFPQTYVSRTFPEEIVAFYRKYPSKDTVPALLYPYGYGDGGGGPVREDVEIGSRLNNMPGFPRCHFTTAQETLHRIQEQADALARAAGQPIPIWKGELYLEFHRGTLTTHARVKRYNRTCEILLREAEIWASLAAIQAGFDYPAADLEAAWKKVLLNQFHDIVPGTSIAPVYPEVYEMYDDVLATARAIIAAASDALTESEGKADGFTVMNSLPWDVTDWVEVDIPGAMDVHIEDADGRTVPHQVVAEHEGGVRIGLEAAAPALGYTTYHVRAGAPLLSSVLQSRDGLLENDRFRVTFDERGQIASIYDKELQREWLAGPGNVFQTFEDRPNHWEAWDVNDWYQQKPLDLFGLVKAEVIEQGPVRVVMRLDHSTANGSHIEQDVVLYRTIPRIDFLTRVDWREQRVLLKTAFPVAVHSPHAAYDIQFGSIERPTHHNTSWDAAKFEVCAHKWSDLSEGNGGVSLLNDCKYGHDVRDNIMRITLLRNAAHPDARCPTPSYLFPDQESEIIYTDTGMHEVRYAFFPHPDDWRSGTVQQAYSFNSPLRVIQGTATVAEACAVSDPALVIEALKRAEDGNGYILRVFEAHGGRHQAAIRLPFALASVEPTDLMERPSPGEGPVEIIDEQSISFFIKPYEIRTFRLHIVS